MEGICERGSNFTRKKYLKILHCVTVILNGNEIKLLFNHNQRCDKGESFKAEL